MVPTTTLQMTGLSLQGRKRWEIRSTVLMVRVRLLPSLIKMIILQLPQEKNLRVEKSTTVLMLLSASLWLRKINLAEISYLKVALTIITLSCEWNLTLVHSTLTKTEKLIVAYSTVMVKFSTLLILLMPQWRIQQKQLMVRPIPSIKMAEQHLLMVFH